MIVFGVFLISLHRPFLWWRFWWMFWGVMLWRSDLHWQSCASDWGYLWSLPNWTWGRWEQVCWWVTSSNTEVVTSYIIIPSLFSQDIDECTNGENNCQQVCVNTEGSFMCECRMGFEPTNSTHCIGELPLHKGEWNLKCKPACAHTWPCSHSMIPLL